MSTVVVVGSSIGGVRTAQALRSEGFAGRIILVGADPHEPYDKPPLSKEYLAGEWDRAQLTLLSAASAERAGIELRLGTPAARLDVADRVVELADGTRLNYDAVVLATGASARPSPWRTPSGVHVLRTLDDSSALRGELERGGPVVVVGGGFIGAEVAATARQLGCEVTVVDPLPSPIGRIVSSEVGAYFADLHSRHGVRTRFGVGVEGIHGVAGELRIRLTDGSVLPAATVVVGIGAVPNVGWLAGSGLAIDDGVLCDQFSRAVDAPDVFAVGDLARWFHPGHQAHVRVEHWTNAVEQAVCAAHNITFPHDLHPYQPVEYVWTNQYDWKIQIVGRLVPGAVKEVIGDFGGTPRAAVLYGNDAGLLCGAVVVNWPKALVRSRRVIASGGPAAEVVSALADAPQPARRRHDA